jgi:hypothetical protein
VALTDVVERDQVPGVAMPLDKVPQEVQVRGLRLQDLEDMGAGRKAGRLGPSPASPPRPSGRGSWP